MTKLTTPVGRSAFSVLNEALGWKGAETNRKFIQRVAFSKEVGEVLVKEIQAEAERLFAVEVERAKAKGQPGRFAQAPINYREDGGEILLTFNRREVDGPPVAVDSSNKALSTQVPRDAGVQVAYEILPYVMNNTFGITLKMLAVKVTSATMSVEAAAALFGGVEEAPVKTSLPKEEDINDLF